LFLGADFGFAEFGRKDFQNDKNWQNIICTLNHNNIRERKGASGKTGVPDAISLK